MSKRRERDPSPEGASGPPRRLVSLLGQGADPDHLPSSAERSTDAGAPERAAAAVRDRLTSQHSTFRDLEAPRDDFDPERSRALCAEVARAALRDFAPALVLLPVELRPRAQALLAYARTVLDFARDRSLEGERLAQINRVEFELEAALDGSPPGQPVFVQMAALERSAPWPRQALDTFAAVARSRVSVGLPAKPEAAEAQRRRIARAALHALSGGPPAPEAEAAAAAVLRAATLHHWHEGLWLVRPDLGLGADDGGAPRFADAIRAEASAIGAELGQVSTAIATLPPRLRPAARYAALSAAALARRAAAAPHSGSPPRLGAAARVALLVRARLSR